MGKAAPTVVTDEWIEGETTEITTLIQEAIYAASPMVKLLNKQKKHSFWSNDLQNQKSAIRKLQKKAKRSGTDSDWEDFLAARRLFRKMLAKSKRLTWKKHLEESTSPKALAQLFKTVQSRTNLRLDLLSGCESDPNKTLDLLMETHFPDSIKGEKYDRDLTTPKNLLQNLTQAEFITEEKVKWSFDSFRPMKSAGPMASSQLPCSNWVR